MFIAGTERNSQNAKPPSWWRRGTQQMRAWCCLRQVPAIQDSAHRTAFFTTTECRHLAAQQSPLAPGLGFRVTRDKPALSSAAKTLGEKAALTVLLMLASSWSPAADSCAEDSVLVRVLGD
jgi:hypothetical protein